MIAHLVHVLFFIKIVYNSFHLPKVWFQDHCLIHHCYHSSSIELYIRLQVLLSNVFIHYVYLSVSARFCNGIILFLYELLTCLNLLTHSCIERFLVFVGFYLFFCYKKGVVKNREKKLARVNVLDALNEKLIKTQCAHSKIFIISGVCDSYIVSAPLII